MTDDRRLRGNGAGVRRTAAAVVVLVGLLSWWLVPPATAASLPLLDVDPLDELEILAVRADDRAQVLFAAPARLMTQTLTSDDVVVTVDGAQQPVRLQRLSATDLELAVVVDTTVSEEDLRALQSAVVELALDLPPGATMRVIDATGTVSEPAPVPGPAIAQVQQLQVGSDDNIQRAVDRATTLLGQSPQDRTALLVVGRDLADRLEPIEDTPLESTVAYVVTVGTGGDELLGPTASGTVLPVDQVARVLPAVDEMSVDLRNLYRAEVPLPGPDAATLTLAIPAAGQDAADRTVALDADTLRPVDADPVQPPAPDDAAGTVPGEHAVERTEINLGRVLAPLLLAGAALAVVAVLWLLAQ
ncbi:MAG: hypothetical protein KY460_11675, partial [Actinobacteria bacterium]|nr:hypothetical protein [Actinomycetota bacterium]